MDTKFCTIARNYRPLKKEDDEKAEVPKPTYNKNAKGVVEGYKYCRNCGNKLPESAMFCDKCGSNVVYE